MTSLRSLTLKKAPIAFWNACNFVCGQGRGVKINVFVVCYLVNMWMKKKLGVVYKKFRKIFVTKKKISPKIRRNHEKLISAYFYVANSTFSCQIWIQYVLSFHLMYILPILVKVRFSPMIFFAVRLGDFGAPLRAKYAIYRNIQEFCR